MCQASKTIRLSNSLINEVKSEDESNLPIQLLGDNQGSLDLINRPEHHSRTKHIDLAISLHYIRKVAEDWG